MLVIRERVRYTVGAAGEAPFPPVVIIGLAGDPMNGVCMCGMWNGVCGL